MVDRHGSPCIHMENFLIIPSETSIKWVWSLGFGFQKIQDIEGLDQSIAVLLFFDYWDLFFRVICWEDFQVEMIRGC
jgi:hypothetical protein